MRPCQSDKEAAGARGAYHLVPGAAEWPPCAYISAATTVVTNSSRPSPDTYAGRTRADRLWRVSYDADDDYPAFCIAAAVRTVADPGSLGIVLGGSGNGEQIAANKVPGARCALAWSPKTASLARQHNNALLIGIGGRMHTVEEALAIVDAFVTTPWSDAPRHRRRVEIMAEYELTGIAPPVPGAPT